jgi:hypothetical protein
MKTVYPLLALLSAVLVAAGPVPIHGDIRSARLSVRTEHLVEPAPVAAPDAAAEQKKAEEEKVAADKIGESLLITCTMSSY